MKKYQNVSLVDLPLSPYDIIIALKDKFGHEEIIRVQVTNALKSISFTGGSRGGIDRTYRSGVKTYVQSTKTSDVIVGVHPVSEDSFELYFVPTVLVEKLHQKSISIGKIQALKNNYFFLENCKDRDTILIKAKQLDLV